MALDRSAPSILIGVRKSGKKKAEPIDLEGRILSLSFDDDEKKADKATLVLDNYDLSLFDEPNLAPGTILDITWGYNGVYSQTQSLVIKSVKGGTKISVSAESKKHIINREHDNKDFENVTYADIAKKIAKSSGFRGDQIFVDDTEPRFEMVVQARMTDAQFLRHLANKVGFEWYIDPDGFHFHERKIGQKPVRKFIWFIDPGQGDITSFSIEEKTTGKAGKVTASGRNPSKKTTHKSSTSATSDKTSETNTTFTSIGSGKGLRASVTNPGSASGNISTSDEMPTSASSQKAGAAIARGRQRRSSLNNVKLTMNCIGDPEISAKSVIEIEGIGKSFSGLYYVEKIKHSVSPSGYSMSMTCKRKGRNSSLGGVVGVKVGGKVNKQNAPKEKGTERAPSFVLTASGVGSGLNVRTVYKKQGKQSKT